MKKAMLVNNLNNPSPNQKKSRTSRAKSQAIKEYILWIASILFSIGALALVSLSVYLNGGTVNVVDSILCASELFFVGITAGISVLLEYDTTKIPDLIMEILTIALIILGAFVYSHYVANEYTSLVNELTVARTKCEAVQVYNNISSGGIFCTIYLLFMFALGSVKYIRKIMGVST